MTAMELAGKPTELMAMLGDPPSSPPGSPSPNILQHMPLSSPTCSGRRRVQICEPCANDDSDIMSSPPERNRKPARSILKRPFNSSPIKPAQDHTNRPPVLRLQEDASSGHVNVVAFSRNDMMKAALAALEANQCPQQNTEYYSSINSVLRMMSLEKRNDYAAMANSLCKCAKRDLMNLKSLSGTLQYQMVTIVTRVLIMVLQSSVCIQNIDPDVAQWFIGNAIAILENESSSKGFVSGQISLINMQQLDHAFTKDNVERLITVLTKGSRFPSSGIIKDFLRAHIILVQQAPNIMLKRANDWVPTIMDAFVDGNKQIHTIACELFEELRRKHVDNTQVGEALITWADKKMHVGNLNLSRFSQLEFSLTVKHRYDPQAAFQSWSTIFVQILNVCFEEKTSWKETERWLDLGKRLLKNKEENIPQFMHSWNAVILVITNRQMSQLPSEAISLFIYPLNQYFECCSDPHDFKEASRSSFSKLAKLLLCSSYSHTSAKQSDDYITTYWDGILAPILQICRRSCIHEDGKKLADLILEKAVGKEPSIAFKRSGLLQDHIPCHEELPALPPKWLKCNTQKVLQEIMVTLDANYLANESSRIDTWANYMSTMGLTISREMRVREDTIVCMADTCTFIKEVWDKYQDSKQIAKLIMPFVRAFDVQLLLEQPLISKDRKLCYVMDSSAKRLGKMHKDNGRPALLHIWSMIVKSRASVLEDTKMKPKSKDESASSSLDSSLTTQSNESGLSERLVVEFVGYLFKVTRNARAKLSLVNFVCDAFHLIEDWRTAAEVAKLLQNEMGAYPSLNASDLVKLLSRLVTIDEPVWHDKDGIYRKLLQDTCDWCDRDKMYDAISVIYAVSQSFVNLTVWRPITVQLAKETLQISSTYMSRDTPVGDLFKTECQNIFDSLGELIELAVGRSVTAGESALDDHVELLNIISDMWVAENPIIKKEILASRIESGLISCLQPRGSSMLESGVGANLCQLVKICLEMQYDPEPIKKNKIPQDSDSGLMVRLVEHSDLVAACLYSQETKVVEYAVSLWNSWSRKKHSVAKYPATLLGAVSIFRRMGVKRIVTSRSFREQARSYMESDWAVDNGNDKPESSRSTRKRLSTARAVENPPVDSQSDTQLVQSVLDKQAEAVRNFDELPAEEAVIPVTATNSNMEIIGTNDLALVQLGTLTEKSVGNQNDECNGDAATDDTAVNGLVEVETSFDSSVESLVEDHNDEDYSEAIDPPSRAEPAVSFTVSIGRNTSEIADQTHAGTEQSDVKECGTEIEDPDHGVETSSQPDQEAASDTSAKINDSAKDEDAEQVPGKPDSFPETDSVIFRSLQPHSGFLSCSERPTDVPKSKGVFNWFTDSLETTNSGPSLARRSNSATSVEQLRSIAEPNRTTTPGRVRTLVNGVQSALQSFSQSIRGGSTPQKLDKIFGQDAAIVHRALSTSALTHDGQEHLNTTLLKRKRELEPMSPNVKRPRTIDHTDTSPSIETTGSTVKLSSALTEFQDTFIQDKCTNKELFELETQLLASLVTIRKAQLLADSHE